MHDGPQLTGDMGLLHGLEGAIQRRDFVLAMYANTGHCDTHKACIPIKLRYVIVNLWYHIIIPTSQ